MPRRNDLSRIVILGSGPIRIGQAAEFDFSGSQACRALRDDGYEVILINSNPATIQNDPEMADRIYIEPLLPEVVRRILEIEKPDALLAGMGGQTALNIASALAKDGSLDELEVELIGCDLASIDEAEDRDLFKRVCESIDLPVCEAVACSSISEVLEAAEKIGKYPLLIRPAFTLGGLGGGTAFNKGELVEIASSRGRKTNKKIKLGICGEHGGDPKSIEFCSKTGLDYVSCSPFRVPVARLAAAQAELSK